MHTFHISHPGKPDAGKVLCDDSMWGQWQGHGWIRDGEEIQPSDDTVQDAARTVIDPKADTEAIAKPKGKPGRKPRQPAATGE